VVEESDRPGRDRGEGPEGPLRRSEGDLLAERRALRATESGEAALVRRAEAAEATVQTLERHVGSLQQRLDDAESERTRLAELLEAERTVAVEREHELRRVKQREYAEQQLRVEAEDRLVGSEREGRADVEGLRARLAASEHEAAELAARLQALQRQLADAEHAAATERASARRSGEDTAARLEELERRTAGLAQRTAELQQRSAAMQQQLERETAARERSERLVESIRDGHRRVEAIVTEVRGALGRLGSALGARSVPGPPAPAPAATPPPSVPRPPALMEEPLAEPVSPAARAVASMPTTYARAPFARAPQPPGERGQEMADALAAAVERLRARAEHVPPLPVDPQAPPREAGARASTEPPEDPQAPPPPPIPEPVAPPAAPIATAPQPAEQARAAAAKASSHKHSMSLIARLRKRRKERRKR
jgi:hypothetical protein